MANATLIDLVQTADGEVQVTSNRALRESTSVLAGTIVLPSPPGEPSFVHSLSPRQAGFSSTEPTQRIPDPVGPIVRFLTRSPTRRFRVLQQWEGVVTKVESDAVVGDLIDLNDHSKPQEVVELPLEEFPPADQNLLSPGCVFYWIIGHETTPGAQLSRVSEIRVRRTPEWSQHAIHSIKEEAKELFSQFKDNVATSNGKDYPSQSG